MKTVLSLFDFSGNWSSPYAENGYQVIRIDTKLGFDVLDFDVTLLESVYGILAAPPCTDFSGSGAQYWKAKDLDGRTEYSMSLVKAVLAMVEYYKPEFWVIENPVGRLSTLFPEIGKPWYFNPNQFAGWLEDPSTDQYTKKTGLWGKFNKPEKKELPAILGNSPIMKLGGKSERTKELRSMTPMGFAKAFYEANK